MNIKELRKKEGMSQTALADAVGVNRHTISKAENGGNVSYATVVKIMDALGYRLIVALK